VKRHLLWLLFLLLCGACVTERDTSPASRLDTRRAPWRDRRVALVIDLYERNPVAWGMLAQETRVAGVIHRASTGVIADRAYAARRAEAKKRGYLWGSYHVGTTNDPVRQADFYLQCVGEARDELLALDLEDVAGQRSMNVAQAQLFLERVHARTGRYPLVYANQSTVLAICHAPARSAVWTHTRLWYARYTDAITDFPTCGWGTPVLWQFASELRPGPVRGAAFFPVPGVRADVDVSVYGGTAEDLRCAWPLDR
jgi:GH25 family lysozyme M1 (1,4-beta-N-acetylmuramidase)